MKTLELEPRTALDRWAARQLADYDARVPGTLFADGIVLSEYQAYELAAAVARLRQQRGETVIGYKIGCTSPRIRQQLAVDAPVFGRLFSTERSCCGAVLPMFSFDGLAIEGELAVELADDVPGDWTGADPLHYIASAFPVIELHNAVFRGGGPSAGELIANNAFHAGFVLPAATLRNLGTSAEAAFHGACSLTIRSGRILDSYAGPGLMEHSIHGLRWLAATLGQHGEQLKAGQIVLTGSLTGLIRIHAPCRISVEVPRLGQVEAEFV